jgi:hypothetical protein
MRINNDNVEVGFIGYLTSLFQLQMVFRNKRKGKEFQK